MEFTMDTDDLSQEAYAAVIIEADQLTRDLTLKFGVLASSCKDESEYLEQSKQLALKIKQLDDFDLEVVLLGNVPAKRSLYFTLDKIIGNIEQVQKIPPGGRHYDF